MAGSLTCAGCGAEKHETEFRLRPGRPRGRTSRCADCLRADQAARYAVAGDARRAYARSYAAARRAAGDEYGKRYRAEAQAIIDALKDAPCTDCQGRFHPQAMDFDHVRGTKRYRISAAHAHRPDFDDELAKCELRCANCHRTRHALERT